MDEFIYNNKLCIVNSPLSCRRGLRELFQVLALDTPGWAPSGWRKRTASGTGRRYWHTGSWHPRPREHRASIQRSRSTEGLALT